MSANTGRLPIIILRTGQNPGVAGQRDPCWISGDPANLGAAASVNALFDLGDNWRQYNMIQTAIVPNAPSSGFSNVSIEFSDSPVFPAIPDRRPASYSSNNTFNTVYSASLTTANGVQAVLVLTFGRYMRVRMTNADGVNAIGPDAAVTVSMHPGV